MTSEADHIQHFLLIYDRRKDQLMSHESFGEDADAAMTAYRAAEIEYRDRPRDGHRPHRLRLPRNREDHALYLLHRGGSPSSSTNSRASACEVTLRSLLRSLSSSAV